VHTADARFPGPKFLEQELWAAGGVTIQ